MSPQERTAYRLTTNPDGAFIAEHDERIVGMAETIVPERLWTLSLLAVHPAIKIVGADAPHEI